MRQGPFRAPLPGGGLITPGPFCLFVPPLKGAELSSRKGRVKCGEKMLEVLGGHIGGRGSPEVTGCSSEDDAESLKINGSDDQMKSKINLSSSTTLQPLKASYRLGGKKSK